jgi:vacuolar-type H+-ATPase subunit B/Vma2
MVSIKELSEEDQWKYAALQEYIKQQFLSGVKKDHQGKATLDQEFELLAIYEQRQSRGNHRCKPTGH